MRDIINKRETCRLCGDAEMTQVISMKPTPVADKYVPEISDKYLEKLYPLDLNLCENCGHLQILDVIDPKYIFDNYTYSSGSTKGMERHFEKYATYVQCEFKFSKFPTIVDVGSNDGTFLKYFKKNNFNVIGIDPAVEIANKATNDGIFTYPEFLSLELSKSICNEQESIEIVSINNTFAHTDNLQYMIDCVKIMLEKSKGLFIFEVSYLIDVINKFLIGTIFHEHLSYHSLTSLKKFLEKNNFRLFNIIRNNIQGGSIICLCEYNNSKYKLDNIVNDLINYEKKVGITEHKIYKNFNRRLNYRKNRINLLLDNIRVNKHRLVGYGAARSGTTILYQYEISKYLDFIVDENKYKHNKYMSGVNILVKPVEEIYKNKIKYILILAWVHSKTIIQKHIDFINGGGSFIICYPKLQIIDSGNLKKYI